MRTNVTKLKLRMEHLGRDEHDRRRVITIQIQNDTMGHTISPMLHSQWAIDMFIASAMGQVPWWDRLSFDDGVYQTRVTTEGMEIWHRQGDVIEANYFTFPMILVAEDINHMQVSRWQRESEYEFPAERLAEIRTKWWPRARMEFTTQKAYDNLKSCLHGEPEHFTAENRKQLTQNLQHLMRIARNNSNGEPAVVTIGTDYMAHSFSWWVQNQDGHRVINGGIIAHPNRDGDGNTIGYEYSTHT